MSVETIQPPLIAKLKDAFLNLERYTPEDIRSLLSDSINALRDAEHVAIINKLDDINSPDE